MSDLARRLGGVLRGAQDRSLGSRALRAGLVTEEELRGPVGIEELLRRKNVSPERIRELREEIDREDFALFRPDRRTPADVAAVAGEPQRRLAEFVMMSRLGQGGVGEVWKAWDTRLGRWVAIKVPMASPDEQGAAERFSREALAAARLSHPNIVSIHRVAEEDGRTFIVMQYVEGRPLRKATLELRTALGILRDVAFAVHYAHEQGVIHRDLKPANIVIGADNRPFVLDFGLAHLQEAGRVQSREGLVAGTASYMSPEQARGEPGAKERATDIYALGATLYEVVTGQAPFDGASFAETLQKVLYAELPAPRTINKDLPRDIETVILKAMEKDPKRRYATARELADDLERYLKGEAVAARQGAMTQTIRRGIRRHPGMLWAAAALMIALGSGAAYFTVRLETLRAEERRRDRELQSFRDVARTALQAMLELRRSGANDRMAEFLPRLEVAYREASEQLPDSGEIDYLMGRAQRTLGRTKEAKALQEQALRKEPSLGLADYELLVMALLAGEPGWVVKSKLDPARSFMVKGQYAKAAEADPSLEEAWELWGRSLLATVTTHSPPALQEKAWSEADAAYTKAIARDRGYLPHWIGRATAREGRALLLRETGREPAADFQGAEDDYTASLRISNAPELLLKRARLRAEWARQRMRAGENPLPRLEEADADLLEAGRKGAAVEEGRTLIRRCAAEYRISKSESPTPELEAIDRIVSSAKGALPPEAWINVALAWGEQALFRIASADDPSAEFKRVEEALAKLGDAPSPEVRERRAWLRVLKARWIAKAAGDPTPDLSAAEKDLDAVLTPGLFFNQAQITRAMVRRAQGEYGIRVGHDPTAAFEGAAKDLTQVQDVNLLSAEAAAERGHLELYWGRYRTKVGDRPGAREHYAQSVRHLEEAVRINDQLGLALREVLREARRGLLGAY